MWVIVLHLYIWLLFVLGFVCYVLLLSVVCCLLSHVVVCAQFCWPAEELFGYQEGRLLPYCSCKTYLLKNSSADFALPMKAILPSAISMSWWNISKTSEDGWWMVQTKVRPSDAIWLICRTSLCAENESSPVVGSSQNSKRGLVSSCTQYRLWNLTFSRCYKLLSKSYGLRQDPLKMEAEFSSVMLVITYMFDRSSKTEDAATLNILYRGR